MNAFQLKTTRNILFGAGTASGLGAAAADTVGRQALVVTDSRLKNSGLLEPVIASLEKAGVGVAFYLAVTADPPVEQVMAAVEMAQACSATGIIGIGGGSPMDVGKLTALLARSREPIEAIYGVNRARGPRLPLVLVPTTAGTGSEVTPIAIVTTGAAEKKGVVSPLLYPDIALLDPLLTVSLPPAVTAATGIDAMVHAIEAYASVNPNNNPVSRSLAREALRMLAGSILRAVHHGQDVEARGAMLLGAMIAGQAFANAAVAAVHALAYPLGGRFHVPHGTANALMLPHVLRFNLPVAAAVYAEIAADAFPDLALLPPGPRAEAFATALADLARDCGLPTRLRDLGIAGTDLPLLAADAMGQTRLLVNNPRPLTEADALAIYRAAW